ncbi:AHH domain-containing protein [Parasulfitobacter algicola]|uniref:AHH domain-containing protein n=1 Tax=Parasulfitobacter algicola TaxID=2614809 RepID=A0ABX2IZF1_9RHOB|nr:AHH domain-containing protein [Sulfitobacter algicola]NSX55733.1 AHH domain-containing protein [Sulfitobacter algicola]
MNTKTPAETLAISENFAAERYQGNIDEAHIKQCGRDVMLNGYYDDMLQTPMAGAKFQFRVNGELIKEARLKTTRDTGGTPGLPLNDQQLGEVGTFVVKDAPEGQMEFEIVPEATQADVDKSVKDLREQINKTVQKVADDYARDWQVWNNASPLERWQLMGTTAQSAYSAGRSKWIDSEKDFFASLYDAAGDAYVHLSNMTWEEFAESAMNVADGIPTPQKVAKDAALYVYSGEAVEDATALYEGGKLIIENAPAIATFMKDFVEGNDDGVERFIIDTLPKLTDDAEGTKWSEYIQNSYDDMQLLLEVVRSPEVRGMIIAAVPLLASAIPPQIWLQNGVGTITFLSYELVVGLLLGMMLAAGTVASGGAGAAPSVGVITLRAAKLARYGKQAKQFIERMYQRLEGIWNKIIAFALKKRAQGRAMSGIVLTAARTAAKRAAVVSARKRSKNGRRCTVCGEKLKRPHPKRSPSLKGVVDRKTGDTGPIRARAAADPSHPMSQGIIMQAHHVVSVQGVKEAKMSAKLKRLGYNIHVLENLSLIPSTMQGACHLGCQVHKSGHKFGDYDYHEEVAKRLEPLRQQIRKSKFCDNKTPQEIQAKVDTESRYIIKYISVFRRFLLSRYYASFRPGNPVGCGGVDAGPKHNPAVPCPSGRSHKNNRNGPGQAREDIKIAASNSYQLEVGR